MIKHTIIGPLPAPFGKFAAGYIRPGEPRFFVVTAGLPSPEAAREEAARLNREAGARDTAAFVDHNLRAPSAEWYRGDA